MAPSLRAAWERFSRTADRPSQPGGPPDGEDPISSRDLRRRPSPARVLLAGTLAAVTAFVGGCSRITAGSGEPAVADPPTSNATTSSVAPISPTPTTPRPTTRRPTPKPTPPPQLPRGGRTIFPTYRVVTYYGAPNLPVLGVLGTADPDTIAEKATAQAAQYAGWGRKIQPAFELITTMAQPCNADYPTCSSPLSPAVVQQYLDAAHRHKMLLLLDIQPGREDFLPQVQEFEQFLLDPSVGVALDPEWKLTQYQYPIQNIGHSSAASINAVSDYLSKLVRAHRLPDKILVIHQFLESMLPDRQNIVRAPGIETVFHADGFGGADAKIGKYYQLALPVPPFHAGFKLFYTRDYGLMTPAQVMALKPRPELVSYQ